jgi:hypothetical protein
VKKTLFALVAVAIAVALMGCATATTGDTGNTGVVATAAYPPKILEHKGSWVGMTELPAWVYAAISGPKEVEKLPEYKDKYVVVVETDADSKEGAERWLAIDAKASISGYLSTRVSDKLAAAEVGDKSKVTSYFERVIKVVSETQFTGFEMVNSWWVYLQTFTPEGKPDKRIYRAMQVWAIDKAMLKTQLDKILEGSKEVAKTEEEKRAMDLVQSSFYDGF